MLTDTQLDEYFIRENLSLTARKIVTRIRTSPPSRRVKSGKKNVSCRYPSRKMKVMIQAESHTNELAAIYEWDHDDATYEFYDQSGTIRLRYKKQGGSGNVVVDHTPDYFVLRHGYTGWEECKTEEHLQKLAKKMPYRYQLDENGVWRCPPGEAYAAEHGLSYRIRSSSENDVLFLRNLQFLSDYFDDDCPRPIQEVYERVRLIFAGTPWMPLIELVRIKDVPADAVYKMIADGNLYFDLYAEALGDIKYVNVFRDELAAKAYRLQISTKCESISQPTLTVDLVPGAEIIWDGNPWKILNVGDTSIHLQNTQGEYFSVTLDAFNDLLKSGQLSGMPSASNPELEKQITEILQSAGPDEMAEAMNRYCCLFPEKYGEPKKPRSRRSIFYYRKAFQKAEQLYGMGFLGLYPKIWKRGNRNRKLDEGTLELIRQVINDTYIQSHQPRKTPAWGELVLRCEEQVLDAPSRKTFMAEIRRFPPHAMEKARRGDRAAYKHEPFYWRIEVDTPRHGDRPFDVVHIDHTELDIELVDQRYGNNLGRPWLSVMIDANTRYVLAIYLTFDPPSHRSCMMLVRECVRKHGRVPRVLVVDGGTEFDSTYFELLTAMLSITKKTRPKAKARFGSVMERFFGITNTQFIHNLRGNTQATRDPRSCSPSHYPQKLAVWTISDLNEELIDWIEQVYSTNIKQALGTTPLKAFQQGMADFGNREHKRVIYSSDFVIACLPSTPKGTAMVDPTRGIKVNHVQYWCAEFSDTSTHGKQLTVRYDPWDLSRAYVFVQHRWALCRSEEADLYSRLTLRELHYATEEALCRLRSFEQVRMINAANVAKGVRRGQARELVLTERRNALAMQQTTDETTRQPELETIACDDWSDANEQQSLYGAF